MKDSTQCRETARLARAYLAGDVAYEHFATMAIECAQDDDIDELHDLIEHMPKRGGLFGLSEKQHDKYMELVEAAIRTLEDA